MKSRVTTPLSVIGVLLLGVAISCNGGTSTDFSGTGGSQSSGGKGGSSSGGASGTGGKSGSGGENSGGSDGSGGSEGTGGKTSSGGSGGDSSGGNIGSGGSTTDTGGSTGAGGSKTGGVSGKGGADTGGASGTGGKQGTGGTPGTGGAPGTGGSTGSTFDWGTTTYNSSGGASVGYQTDRAHQGQGGQLCMNPSCHGHRLNFGGTTYQANGSSAAANVQIGVIMNGTLTAVYSGSAGNFYGYLTNPSWSTAQIAIRTSAGTQVMPTNANVSGECNSCHNSSNRIVTP